MVVLSLQVPVRVMARSGQTSASDLTAHGEDGGETLFSDLNVMNS